MPENAKDTLTTDHVKNLILSLAELNKVEAECKKEGESSDEYKELLQKIKACGDLKAKIEACKAGIANMLLTDSVYVNTRKNLTDLVNAAKKALNAIKAFQKKPWVVTCNPDVMKMAKSKSCACCRASCRTSRHTASMSAACAKLRATSTTFTAARRAISAGSASPTPTRRNLSSRAPTTIPRAAARNSSAGPP